MWNGKGLLHDFDPGLIVLQWRIQTFRKRVGEGGGLQNIFFRPLGPQFGLKIKEVQVPRAPPLDPPLCFIHLGLPVI